MSDVAFENVEVARSFGRRLVGLMREREVPEGYALVFPRCSSVHSHFMKAAIDVLYLDSRGEVLSYETLEPWRLGKAPRGTRAVAECRAGEAARLGIEPGDRLLVDGAPAPAADGG